MSVADFNTLLAFVLFFAAVTSIARMNGTTRHCVRAGILMILVASLGQAIGGAFDRWEHWLDTLLYLGIGVILVFNRRYKKPPPEAT